MARGIIACESSGRMREAFRKHGHDVWSCDILPADDGSPFHFQRDVRDILENGGGSFDFMIAHPPCTYLTVAGLFRNKGNPERQAKTEEALAFVRFLMDAPIRQKVIENPVSCISTRIRKPDQIIQPHDFGEDASKKTCLWIEGLPLLTPTRRIEGRLVEYPPGSGKFVRRWANQTDSGQNRLPPSEDRWKLRSLTYQGIADAFGAQYGPLAGH